MRVLKAFIAVTAVLPAAGARAQNVDTLIFQPAGPSAPYLSQDSPVVLGHDVLGFGGTFDVARDVLVARDRDTGEILQDGRVVGDRLGFHLVVGYGLGGVAEVGIGLPVVLAQSGSLRSVRSGEVPTATLGDMRFSGKLRLWRGRAMALAVAATVTLPTASPNSFAGGDGSMAWPRLVLGWANPQANAAVTLGYRVRGSTQIANLVVDDEVTCGVAASVRVLRRGLWAVGEAYLATGVSSNGSPGADPAEALVGARYAVSGTWAVQAGVGVGLTRGYGAPSLRGVLGLEYVAGRVISRRPGTRTAGDGDADGDGVPDGSDRCPRERGAAADGCPEGATVLDSDGDGLADAIDACPKQAEDRNGVDDDDGCPDADGDGDGVPDVRDACPEEAEDIDGFHDTDGCPDYDNDGDGILDLMDSCSTEPEVFNGYLDDDGCPDEGEVIVVPSKGRLEVRRKVVFTAKPGVEKRSGVVVDTLARVLLLHPEVRKARIVVHCAGGVDAARAQAQADALKQILVRAHGVEAERLETGTVVDPAATSRTERTIEVVIVEIAK